MMMARVGRRVKIKEAAVVVYKKHEMGGELTESRVRWKSAMFTETVPSAGSFLARAIVKYDGVVYLYGI